MFVEGVGGVFTSLLADCFANWLMTIFVWNSRPMTNRIIFWRMAKANNFECLILKNWEGSKIDSALSCGLSIQDACNLINLSVHWKSGIGTRVQITLRSHGHRPEEGFGWGEGDKTKVFGQRTFTARKNKIKAHVLKKMVSNLQLAIKVFQSYLKLE